MNWKTYFKKQEKRKPREQLVQALFFCKNMENALELGAGTFIESKFLIEKGFKNVVAIDNAPEAKVYTKKLDKKIKFKNISFQEYDFPKNTFDLINAQFALPFHGKKGFNLFIKKVTNSLRPRGVFVGQFFGIRDSWNDGKRDLVFHKETQALKMLSGLKILKFIEEEKDGKTTLGQPKHWHIFHFIAQKE